MWRCELCGEHLEDSYNFCWKCGAKRVRDATPKSTKSEQQVDARRQKQKWEYQTIKFNVFGWLGPKVDPSRLDSTLNTLGASGWELVSVFDVNVGEGATSSIIAIFKRPA